jgi:hypothetical protein
MKNKHSEMTKNKIFDISFIDVFAYIASSLDDLANNLRKNFKMLII